MRVNLYVIRALVRRDLRRYFSNPTGYVFLTLFIFLSAAAAFWQERFFLNNLADLGQLNGLFPILLLFYIPALTMGAWADERRQGTEELLLTLPATDLEIVLGKYLATAGVYTASVLLSLSHVGVLLWLGSPDLGLIFGNYLGYWLAGAALIAVGMLASLLTSNVTIAFILGAVFCSAFVFVSAATWTATRGMQEALAPLGLGRAFEDFAGGLVSLRGLLYFASLAGLMLYLNVVLLSRRHWPLRAEGMRMPGHHAIRAVALAVALVGFNALLGRTNLRLDVTSERLRSLSGETRRLLREIPKDRPVFVHAFVSPEVPRSYVETRENLLASLREMESAAGSRVQVAIRETEPFTPEAADARETYGIQALEVLDPGSARSNVMPVYMGVAFTCGASEHVIPFLDRGLPVEYELARSIRVVSRSERKKIGVVMDEAKVFGGFDFQAFRNNPAWPVVEELKKQYEVVTVNAEQPVTERYDALLLALPSSLPQPAMDNVLAVIQGGTPALILADPLPVLDIGLSPSEQPGANVNPFMRNQGPPPKPKGDVRTMLAALGVAWDTGVVTWDSYNPHPDLAQVQPEIIFLGRGNQNPATFNAANPVSQALEELVLLYPGELAPAEGTSYDVQPLLRTSRTGGTLPYQHFVQRSFFGVQLMTRGQRHDPSGGDHVLAVEVKGGVHAIVVADLDFISDQFFELRRRGFQNLDFDNVPFFLNCMDALTGDESFVDLRNKRARHRTLTRVEAQTRDFVERRVKEEKEAEEAAQKALTEAQGRLDASVAAVRERTDLDEQTKTIMARNLQEVETRRFEARRAAIDAERDRRIQRSKEGLETDLRRIQSSIKTLAVLLPPVPVFALGIVIFVKRARREREGAAAAQRLRG